MTHLEFAPPLTLQYLINCCWLLEEPQEIFNRDCIVSDSYVELILNCGAPLVWEPQHGQQIELPQAFVIRLHTQPLRLRATGLCQIIGIRFYAWSVLPLLESNRYTRQLPFFEVAQGWQAFAQSLRQTVHQRGYAEAIANLQDYLTDTYPQPLALPYAVRMAGPLLYANPGQQRIAELAVRCSLSLSQFERQFKHWTGVTPKTLARLIRFEAVRDRLVHDPFCNISDLAYQFGYADQAHFIHEFRTFSTWTPRTFAAQVQARQTEDQHADFLQYS
jgi:AraC-like DNA-binding protein